jgi:hypothetical protein
MNTDNYPDDIENYSDDPRSPLYDDGGLEVAEHDLREDILSGDCTDKYSSMFDSADSDDVLVLLRDFHSNQSDKSIKQLIAKLDSMLERLVKETIEI